MSIFQVLLPIAKTKQDLVSKILTTKVESL